MIIPGVVLVSQYNTILDDINSGPFKLMLIINHSLLPLSIENAFSVLAVVVGDVYIVEERDVCIEM